jgi:hypothetical protein
MMILRKMGGVSLVRVFLGFLLGLRLAFPN